MLTLKGKALMLMGLLATALLILTAFSALAATAVELLALS